MKALLENLEAIETEFRYGVGVFMYNKDCEWFQKWKRSKKHMGTK